MIDFDTLILSYLPHCMRRVRIFAFIKVLVSPIVRLYNLFLTFKQEQIINQSGTPQTCMLKRMIHDQLGLDVDIVEDNGLPNDFIVKVSSQQLDKERQLVALVNKYKQAGKSFALNNAAVIYTQTWGGFVCEQQTISEQWGGFICEQAEKRLNTVTANYIHEGNQFEITVQPTYSPVTIQIVVGIRNSLYGNAYTTIIIYSNDTSYPDEQILTIEYEAGDFITDMHLVVESDDNYDYELITNITN